MDTGPTWVFEAAHIKMKFDVDEDIGWDKVVDENGIPRCRDPSDMAFFAPEVVLAMIDTDFAAGKMKSFQVSRKCLRFGSYECPHAPVESRVVHFTELGITLWASHSVTGASVKICIPLVECFDVRIYFGDIGAAFFLQSGTKYADWIRIQLGLSSDNMADYYARVYSPMAVHHHKRWMAFSTKPVAKEDEKGITALFEDCLRFQVLNYKGLLRFCLDEYKALKSVDRIYTKSFQKREGEDAK